LSKYLESHLKHFVHPIQDGWNPVNDIESVIVSIRSLLVVGDGRLEAASALPEAKYTALLEAANQKKLSSSSKGQEDNENPSPLKKQKSEDAPLDMSAAVSFAQGGSYSVSEAQAAYSHLSDYHKKKGWDTSGWWARKG
jgi:ubiquitin-conjugating enzyme E2 Q